MIPRTNDDAINYLNAHITPWEANAATIGLTAGEVASLTADVAAAEAARDEAISLREQSKAATAAFEQAMRTMRNRGATMIRQIRTTAIATNDEKVYQLAQIPAPRQPGPVGVPGKPYEVAATLLDGGVLGLAWKCDNPGGASGTTYNVDRRVPESGQPWTSAGVADERKRFEDATLPAAAAWEYRITAVRSGKTGQPTIFTMRLGGTQPGATLTITPMKAAA